MSASGRGPVCGRWAAVAAAVLLGTACASAPPAVPALPGEEPLGAGSGESAGDEAAWGQDDREDDLAQLLAQAEANLGGGRGLDPVQRDEIVRWAEELRSAVEREAALLESGAAPDEIATAGSDVSAAADALRAALAAVADAPGLDPSEEGAGGLDPGVQGSGTPILERIVGVLDGALLALDRIHQIRSSLRAFSNEDGAPPGGQGWDGSSWPAEELDEVSGVVTLDGEPLAGARVAEPTLGLEATTDAGGAYRLPLPPRASRLVVTRDGRRVAEGPVHVRRGRGALADFEVHGGRMGTKRARILPSDVALRRQGSGPTGMIRAVVQDAKGQTLPRTLVRLDGKAAARTDGQGRCLFRGVSSGPHRLAVVGSKGPALHSVHVEPSRVTEAKITLDAPLARAARPRPPLTRPQHRASRAPQPRPSPREAARSSSRPAPAPARGCEIGGRVTSGGRPVAGVAVTIKGRSTAHARTGRDGSYSIRVPSGGKYRVRVGKSGFEDEERSVQVGDGERATLSFELRAEGAREKARAPDRSGAARRRRTSKEKPEKPR